MFNGHINIGKRLTIYGDNAMHWGVTFYTNKYGFICFRLPFKSCGSWWPLYLYFSPNGTPQASTFMLGRKHDFEEWTLSRIRYTILGHNFSLEEYNQEFGMTNYQILRGINRGCILSKEYYAKWQKTHPERD